MADILYLYEYTIVGIEEIHLIYDSISINTLKIIMIEISPCITLIINQCLSSGIFLNKLKMARVVPIFKKNNKTLIQNYRPISILPAISKIVENFMHSQLNI